MTNKFSIKKEPNSDCMVGGVRLSKCSFDIVQKLAKNNDLSPQSVIRQMVEFSIVNMNQLSDEQTKGEM